MTYCVALKLQDGLICLSDTRTNAGVDNISRFKKMFTWVSDNRAMTLMTAGNLAITQAVMSQLQEDIDNPVEGRDTILSAHSMFRVAEIVGGVMHDVQSRYGPGLMNMGENASSSIIVAGQRRGGKLRLFTIYAAGNFIEATDDTPFFQLGEHKYGKPILDRVIEPDTSLGDGLIAALLSMDSTLRSNLSVGMPLDLSVLRRDTFAFEQYRRIENDSPDFADLSQSWSNALREAFIQMRSHRV